jgi:lipoprotein-releasing system permease protein
MPPIILGKDMAEEIGATVGSVVLVTSPQGELTPFGMVPKYIRFHVAGIFNSGFYDYDSSWAFIRLADAQSLFGLGDVISVIQFKLDDIYQAGERRPPTRTGRRSSQEATASWPPTGWNRTSLCSAPCAWSAWSPSSPSA